MLLSFSLKSLTLSLTNDAPSLSKLSSSSLSLTAILVLLVRLTVSFVFLTHDAVSFTFNKVQLLNKFNGNPLNRFLLSFWNRFLPISSYLQMELTLTKEDAAHWVYRGEGAINLVLAYSGASLFYIGKVMRIRKIPRKGSKSQGVRNTIALTPHERLIWKDVGELISSSDKEIAGQLYVQHVMKPLLGSKYVDVGVFDLLKTAFGRNPGSLTTTDRRNPMGLLQPNAMRLADIFRSKILTATISLSHLDFLSCWCSSSLPETEEDVSLEYDVFASVGWVNTHT